MTPGCVSRYDHQVNFCTREAGGAAVEAGRNQQSATTPQVAASARYKP